jgi:multiple sugar transport system permease protein
MEARRFPIWKVCLYFALGIVLLIYLFPIYWTLTSSLKSMTNLMGIPTVFPLNPTLENYEDVIGGTSFLTLMRNSLIVAISVSLVTLILASTAAYSLSRFRYPGRRLLSQLILLVYLFPGILLIIPVFVMMTRLGLYNSIIAVIITHVLFTLPFAVWTLKLFFDTISEDLDAAARIDGAGRFTILRVIYIPLAAPGIAAATIFSFVVSWNEYLFASILVANENLDTSRRDRWLDLELCHTMGADYGCFHTDCIARNFFIRFYR